VGVVEKDKRENDKLKSMSETRWRRRR